MAPRYSSHFDGLNIELADSPSLMAAKVILLLQSEIKRRKLEMAAHQFAQQRANWNMIVDRLEEVYRQAKSEINK